MQSSCKTASQRIQLGAGRLRSSRSCCKSAPHLAHARLDASRKLRCAAEAPVAERPQPVVTELSDLSLETDTSGRERVALSEVGWKSWTWQGHRVNFIQAGDSGAPLLLIHGFGASSYHWRYNIPELAKKHRVFALDLLGFGFSEKALTDYTGAQVWSRQVADFIREVVGDQEKVVLAGNSLGGFVSLAAAARHPELVKGLICLNSAGFFEDPNAGDADEDAEEPNPFAQWWKAIVATVQEALKRVTILIAFYSTKSKVKQVLDRVYSNTETVDEDLVRSILLPSEDKNAAEVFYRIVSGTAGESRTSIDSLLRKLQVPLFLLWGDQDPWMGPEKASKMMSLYENSEKLSLEAGHCPHDEVPDQVNEAILKWMSALE